MSRLIRADTPFLQLIYQINVKQRKALIQIITKDQLHAVCEIVLNVYRDSFHVSDAYKKASPLQNSH